MNIYADTTIEKNRMNNNDTMKRVFDGLVRFDTYLASSPFSLSIKSAFM